MSEEVMDSTYNDDEQFIIPLVVMNDGMQVAEIKGTPKGIYKDVSRSPFLRRTGFIKNGALTDLNGNAAQDLDITPLVRYGTLEQARVAPTLENLDIKLYYRDKDLHKFPPLDENGKRTEGIAADTYIWREIPAGLQLYNNDTVWGYDWVVLQDDYVGIDGLYNLHMDVEDGKGICKVTGSRGPMVLNNVEYMLIVTAKNLWNREFSLLEDFPLAKTMDVKTDATAPTVAAVIDYYKKKVETAVVKTEALEVGIMDKNGNIKDPLIAASVDEQTGPVAIIKNLKVKNIEIEDKKIVYKEDLDSHITTTVKNPAKDKDGNVVGVHGIHNDGINGNINAHALDGAVLSNGFKSVEQDVEKGSYIPFVNPNAEMGIGLTTTYFNAEGVPYLTKSIKQDGADALNMEESTGLKNVKKLVKRTSVGASNKFNESFTVEKEGLEPTIAFTTGNAKTDNVTIKANKIESNEIVTSSFIIDGRALKPEDISNNSSIALKNPKSEWIGIHWDKAYPGAEGWKLNPNRDTDVWGNEIKEPVSMPGLKNNELLVDSNLDNSLAKLGSALQALYELPVGTFEYTRDENHWKTQLGIFIERVNQYRDNLKNVNISVDEKTGVPVKDNYLVHKRNSLIQSKNENVLDFEKGYAEIKNIDPNKNREVQNSYTYTEEELKSLIEYFNLITDKDELAQNIRCTVNVLLLAAKETQKRLLDIETNVYGWDSPTLPGHTEKYTAAVNDKINPDLQTIINNQPLFIGLNRAMRAVCLEIFNASELDEILSEAENQDPQDDSSGRLKEKVTVMSRMDKIGELLSVAKSQLIALKKYYIREHENTHTYTPIVNVKGEDVISEPSTEESTLESLTTLDCHIDKRDYDKGHTWKTLPSEKDIRAGKETTAFANVYENIGLHTPDIGDCGTIRVPEYEIDEESRNNGNMPIFRTRVVAWDSAKLERINQKLSEVTEAVYGVDEVASKYPNRTEVIRRNINNLVDDLYPNRFFPVEKTMGDKNPLKVPFKKSKVTDPGKNTVATSWTLITDVEDPQVVDPDHTSIITYFDNALYNFRWNNNYWAGGDNSLKNPTKLQDKNQVSVTTNNSENGVISIFEFNTAKLITDPVVPGTMEDYKTYKNAVSSIDMLSSIIGTENAFFKNLAKGNVWEVFNNGELYDSSTLAINGRKGSVYENELKFLDGKSTKKPETQSPHKELQYATTVNSHFSRKNKSIVDRLTTVEAALDSWAEWAEKNKELSNNGFYTGSEEIYNNVKVAYSRFEEVGPTETLKELSIKNTNKINRWFDLDVADTIQNDKVRKHNNVVYEMMQHWEIINKSGYVANGVEGSYTLSCVTPDNKNKTIYVKYVNTFPTTLSTDTIYMPVKELNNLDFSNFVSNTLNETKVFKSGANRNTGFQNETEYLIYKCIHTMFNDLLGPSISFAPEKGSLKYQMFLLTHPVNSIYYTKDLNEDPNKRFGGTWQRLSTGGELLVSGAAKDISHHHSYYRATGTTSNPAKSYTFTWNDENGSHSQTNYDYYHSHGVNESLAPTNETIAIPQTKMITVYAWLRIA